MARPVIKKTIEKLPDFTDFKTCRNPNNDEVIAMTVEEYECMRLIDYEGLNQQECAVILGVGRTTVQRLYDQARKKIARFMVEGARLSVEGGNYEVDQHCRRKCNRGRRMRMGPNKNQ